jgi:ElaB/YqjD/DUF883 family membrane-anchored ribosome-binding protein
MEDREWATSEARDLADAAHRRMNEARRETKDHAAEAKESVRGAVRQTKEYVENVRDHVEDAVQQARAKMTQYREGGVDKMKHDVVGYTRERPLTTLLIVAGAGLVLGWLSAAGRR